MGIGTDVSIIVISILYIYIYTHPFIVVSIIILDKYSLFFVIHGKMMFIITPPFKKMISHISSQCCIHIIVSCIYIYISMLSHKYIHGITIPSNISIPYIPSHKYSLLSIIYYIHQSHIIIIITFMMTQ